MEKTNLSHVPAIKWGKDHEDDARQEYISEASQSHEGFQYATAGLVVNPLYPYLGATPDGLIKCHCCGEGLIEIKCPYSMKDDHPRALQSRCQTFKCTRSCILTQILHSNSRPTFCYIEGPPVRRSSSYVKTILGLHCSN